LSVRAERWPSSPSKSPPGFICGFYQSIARILTKWWGYSPIRASVVVLFPGAYSWTPPLKDTDLLSMVFLRPIDERHFTDGESAPQLCDLPPQCPLVVPLLRCTRFSDSYPFRTKDQLSPYGLFFKSPLRKTPPLPCNYKALELATLSPHTPRMFSNHSGVDLSHVID